MIIVESIDMDDSMSSTNYTSKSLPLSSRDDSSSQESGWTLYLEDFIDEIDDIEAGSSSSSGCQNSSMVSGTAWSAVRKLGDDNQQHVKAACLSLHRSRNKLISKRRKTRSTFVDQELEDTASSPVQSPKVNDLNHLYMKSKQMDSRLVCQAYEKNHFQNEQSGKDCTVRFPQEKGHILQQQLEEGIEMGFLVTELRRKGLCLVPMSMLLNFHN